MGIGYSRVKMFCQQGRLGYKEGKHWVITDEELEAFAAIPRQVGCTSEQAKKRWAKIKERQMENRPNIVRILYEAPGICGELDAALSKVLEPLGYHIENCGSCFGPGEPMIERDIEFWLEDYEPVDEESE